MHCDIEVHFTLLPNHNYTSAAGFNVMFMYTFCGVVM